MVERVEQIYQALIEIGLSEEEINKEIDDKLIEYQGFMTRQAVLFLIAKENGINIYSSEHNPSIQQEIEGLIDYNEFAIPISNVSEGMRNIVMTGRIVDIFGVRNFVKKDGTPGTVGSFQICDQSECIKIVLWDDQVKIIENEFFQEGEIIQIVGGYSKKGIEEILEVHVSTQGKIILAPKDVGLPEVKSPEDSEIPVKSPVRRSSQLTIQDLHEKEGFIKFISGTVGIDEFKELTLKDGEKSFLLKLILSDEASSIRVNIWGMNAVECVKMINDGDAVKFSNVMLKMNSYSSEKELSFIKSSRLEII